MELIPVDPDLHTDVLYKLLLLRPVEANISHRKMPTLEQHERFVRAHPYLAWYVIQAGDGIIGATYLTHRREIGIFLRPEKQRRGYGRTAVAMLMNAHPGGDFYANVSHRNIESQVFFEEFGFELLQFTYVLRQGGQDATQKPDETAPG